MGLRARLAAVMSEERARIALAGLLALWALGTGVLIGRATSQSPAANARGGRDRARYPGRRAGQRGRGARCG